MDLFLHYEKQPKAVREICDRYMEAENDYPDCERFKSELEAIGYTCDYGLDAEPYSLRRFKELSATERIVEPGDYYLDQCSIVRVDKESFCYVDRDTHSYDTNELLNIADELDFEKYNYINSDELTSLTRMVLDAGGIIQLEQPLAFNTESESYMFDKAQQIDGKVLLSYSLESIIHEVSNQTKFQINNDVHSLQLEFATKLGGLSQDLVNPFNDPKLTLLCKGRSKGVTPLGQAPSLELYSAWIDGKKSFYKDVISSENKKGINTVNNSKQKEI